MDYWTVKHCDLSVCVMLYSQCEWPDIVCIRNEHVNPYLAASILLTVHIEESLTMTFFLF